MILRKRNKPLALQKYEALQARLPANSEYHASIERQIELATRGYQGELNTDKYLTILSTRFTILEDVCLVSGKQTFQIDTILITPNALYIIEVKSLRSNLTFDTNLNQFITGSGNRQSGYNHPITQAKAQKLKLQNWLFEHNQPNIPIHIFIAISEPSTIINVIGDHEKIANTVTHSENIPWKIIEYEKQYTANQKYQHQKIGHVILKHCKDFDLDILTEQRIPPRQLIPGIRCHQCNYLGMTRVKWSWICPRCQYNDKMAAIKGIDEYLLLVKPWAINKEILNYLNIDSRYVVSRLLKSHPRLQYARRRRRWERGPI